MARPKKVTYSPEELLRLRIGAGLGRPTDADSELSALEDPDALPTLSDRIRTLLQLIRRPADNPYDMLYLVMYDISDDRVRKLIADYLIGKGCTRIQKSVYLARTASKVFQEINESLAEVQAAYDNHDSILLIPVQASTVGSIKVIGKDIAVQSILDPPTTLFY